MKTKELKVRKTTPIHAKTTKHKDKKKEFKKNPPMEK
jgi:hypothetical protein